MPAHLDDDVLRGQEICVDGSSHARRRSCRRHVQTSALKKSNRPWKACWIQSNPWWTQSAEVCGLFAIMKTTKRMKSQKSTLLVPGFTCARLPAYHAVDVHC